MRKAGASPASPHGGIMYRPRPCIKIEKRDGKVYLSFYRVHFNKRQLYAKTVLPDATAETMGPVIEETIGKEREAFARRRE